MSQLRYAEKYRMLHASFEIPVPPFKAVYLTLQITNYESCIEMSAKNKVKRKDFKASFSINQCVH